MMWLYARSIKNFQQGADEQKKRSPKLSVNCMKINAIT